MKNKRNKTKVPAHSFGMMAAQAGLQAIGGIIGNLQNKDLSTGQAVGAGLLSAIPGVGGALSGLITGNAEEKARQRVKLNQDNQVISQAQTANLTNQYYDRYGDSVYTFANGGLVPSYLAYLDNNEVVRGIDGSIGIVPNTTSGTDQYLVNAAGLESVLSDKLKRPGTKKTFAEHGQALMTKPSKGNDKFAEATNRLNNLNAQSAYNQLLAEQEQYKFEKGIKPKTKDIPAFVDGGFGLNSIWNTPMNIGFGRTTTTPEYNGINNVTPAGRLPFIPMLNLDIPSTNKINTATAGALGNQPTTRSTSVALPTLPTSIAGVTAPSAAMPDVATKLSGLIGSTPGVSDGVAGDGLAGFNFGNIASTLGAITPIISNTISGLRKPEVEQPIPNPYSAAATRLMSSRRMNVDPVMDANRTTRAISNYNTSRYNPNTGMNLAARTQMAADEQRANANLFAAKQNADNQYRGETAQSLLGLGRDYAESLKYTNDINARNRAMARNYLNTAASQLGQFSQIQQQMANQRRSDQMVMPALTEYLSQGFDTNVMAQINAAMANYRR